MRALIAVAALALAACGGVTECKLTDARSCPSDQVCEPVTGRAKPVCFKPVLIEGKVTVLGATTAIAGAEVSATADTGAAVGTVATSGADGTYSLRVPSTRSDEKGTVVGQKVLLRAAAKDFEVFPSGVRVSLPVDTSAPTHASDGPWVVQSALTDIGLQPVPDIEKGRAGIAGTVQLPPGQSALVVASGAAGTFTAVTDSSGAFHVFNVAAGSYEVQAYTKGFNYTPAMVTVASADVTGVTLSQAGAATTDLSGSVQLVAGANGAGTSVVLAVESTFNVALARGEIPYGLRAPDMGTPPNVTGAFTIHGVPDGKYVVLAAFENDGNVRDPDPNIAGTQVVHVTVGGGTVTPSGLAFKVTGAVEMSGPGADGTVESTSATPTFSWKAYSSAKSYTLTVYSATGTKVWENTSVPAGSTSAAYAGPALTSGGIYQWRLTAFGNNSNPISLTEELRGLFQVQ